MTKFYAQEKRVFDINKVTVVGSPTITSDGVLSKTSESTYLKISNNIVKQLEGKKSWRIDFKGVMPDNNAYQNITGQSAGVVGMLNIGSINGSGNFFVQIYAEDGTNKAIYVPGGVANNHGKEYIGYASYNGNDTYTIALSVDNGTTWKTSSATWDKTVYFGGNDLKVGYRLLTGSLDLTAFKIYVDNELVYSPTKPVYSLERRKPMVWDKEQFTVVGNPSISDSGVATYISGQNYVYIPPIDYTKPFAIRKIGFTQASTGSNCYFINGARVAKDFGGFTIGFNGSTRKLRLFLGSTGNDWNISAPRESTTTLELNKPYYVDLIYSGTNYTCILYDNNLNELERLVVNNSTPLYQSGNGIMIGSNYINATVYNGNIYLANITVENDGVVVFDGGKQRYLYDSSKFTVKGSPTISESGVASGFSASNYIVVSPTISNANNVIIKSAFLFKETNFGEAYCAKGDNLSPRLLFRNTNRTMTAYYFQSSGSIAASFIVSYDLLKEDNWYYTEVYLSNDSQRFKVFDANGNIIYSQSHSQTLTIDFASVLSLINLGMYNANEVFNSSIDLTQFSITVDGKEVFTGAKEKFYAMRGM